jgi:hypothetical protein
VREPSFIEIACACGKRFRVAEKYAGRRIKCPACGEVVTVPAPAAFPDDLVDTTKGDDAESPISLADSFETSKTDRDDQVIAPQPPAAAPTSTAGAKPALATHPVAHASIEPMIIRTVPIEPAIIRTALYAIVVWSCLTVYGSFIPEAVRLARMQSEIEGKVVEHEWAEHRRTAWLALTVALAGLAASARGPRS